MSKNVLQISVCNGYYNGELMIESRKPIFNDNFIVDFDGKKHTNSFTKEACKAFVGAVKKICLQHCKCPIEMSQKGLDENITKLMYFGQIDFQSETYWLEIEQTVYFHPTCWVGGNHNLKESFVLKCRNKKEMEPTLRKICEFTDSWCIMEDVDTFRSLKNDFKFLLLNV